MAIIVQQDPVNASREIMSSAFENEQELEDILIAHPHLLRGAEEDELFFVAKQIILPDAGKIDLFLVSSEGLPVITEVKLGRNQEARREIVAQAFDYVSALTLLDLLRLDKLVDNKLQEILEQQSLSSQSEDLWMEFNENLKSAKTRFILAVDEAPEGLLRIMEFLTNHTNLDVRLIEIQKFKEADGSCTFVPTVKVERTETKRRAFAGSSSMVINPEYIAFYNSMQDSMQNVISSRLTPRNDDYRYAYVRLKKGCLVRYDIPAAQDSLKISFKSCTRSADTVREKVEQQYPNWKDIITGHQLTFVQLKGDIIAYVINIEIPTSGLNSESFVKEASTVFKLLVDKFSPVADELN